MYKGVPFRMQPMEWIEEDLQELRAIVPDATTIQLLSANPLILTCDKLAPILDMINKYLPKMQMIYTQGRVSDLNNKTVEQLRTLKDLGMREISLGVESGDDWTLERIHKGYRAADIIEQCARLTEAWMDFWMSFLNGVAGRPVLHSDPCWHWLQDDQSRERSGDERTRDGRSMEQGTWTRSSRCMAVGLIARDRQRRAR